MPLDTFGSALYFAPMDWVETFPRGWRTLNQEATRFDVARTQVRRWVRDGRLIAVAVRALGGARIAVKPKQARPESMQGKVKPRGKR